MKNGSSLKFVLQLYALTLNGTLEFPCVLLIWQCRLVHQFTYNSDKVDSWIYSRSCFGHCCLRHELGIIKCSRCINLQALSNHFVCTACRAVFYRLHTFVLPLCILLVIEIRTRSITIPSCYSMLSSMSSYTCACTTNTMSWNECTLPKFWHYIIFSWSLLCLAYACLD